MQRCHHKPLDKPCRLRLVSGMDLDHADHAPETPEERAVLNAYFRRIGARGGRATAERGHNVNLFDSERAREAALARHREAVEDRAAKPENWRWDGKRWRRRGAWKRR